VPNPGGAALTLRASAPGLVAAPAIVPAGSDAPVTLRLALTAVDERVVVTASQTGQALSALADSITVLGQADLDSRQQFGLAQALRSVPGLTLQQTGGPGAQTSLFLRGGESDFTLLLIDGVRANSLGGGLDVSQVPLTDVDRIEVVRGPQSALHGSDAVAGVIQVITRTGGAPTIQAVGEGGSRQMRRGAVSTTGERGRVFWQAGADGFSDAGYTGSAPDGTAVSNDDARIWQGAATLGWRTAAGTDIRGTWRLVDTDRGVPGPVGSDPARRFASVDRTSRNLTRRHSGAVRVSHPWFGRDSRIRQRTDVDLADFTLTSAGGNFPSMGYTRRRHARTQTDVVAGSRLGLSAGADWLQEDGGSTFITADGRALPVTRQQLGLFAEARLHPHPRLTLVAGARTERIARDALPGDLLGWTPRPAFPRDLRWSVNPKLSAQWLVARSGAGGAGRDTRVHAAAGTGIRPPDAFEMAFTDNNGLRPERSRSMDIGLTQTFAEGRVHVDATAFVNTFDDLIIAVGRSFTGVSRWRTDNIANARARGLELTSAWRPSRTWSLQGHYTFISSAVLAVDGTGLAPTPYTVGDRLLRRPAHQGGLDAQMTLGRLNAFGQWQWRGQSLDAEPHWGPSGGLYANPAYALVNAGVAVTLRGRLSVTGRVMNLGNIRYEEVLGYPSPGRILTLGLRVAARH
jgi:outer membrane cobalamin receptor